MERAREEMAMVERCMVLRSVCRTDPGRVGITEEKRALTAAIIVTPAGKLPLFKLFSVLSGWMILSIKTTIGR